FTDDIESIQTDDHGLIITFADQTTLTMKCDVFTAYYYQSKLSYELMYKKSTHQSIFDYLMSHCNRCPLTCSYDEATAMIRCGRTSIQCDRHSNSLKEELKVLNSYLTCLQELNHIQHFVAECEEVPVIVKEPYGF